MALRTGVPSAQIGCPLDIVKYFYEEPVHLEAFSAETDPDARRRDEPALPLGALLAPASYFRGYLAGSQGDRVGLTTTRPEAFLPALLGMFGRVRWTVAEREGRVARVADPSATLVDPAAAAVLVGTVGTVGADDLRAVATAERRYGIPALRRLLDAGATVCFPEPAHDGWDWSLFSPTPLKDRLVQAFRAHPVEDVRRFVLAYPRARSEHKFYFERWALDDLPGWVEEL